MSVLKRLVIVGAERPPHDKVINIARVLDVDDPQHIFFFHGNETLTEILSEAFRRDPSTPSGYATRNTEALVTRRVSATDKLRMKQLAKYGVTVKTDYDNPHFATLSDVGISTWYNRGDVSHSSQTPSDHDDNDLLTFGDLLSVVDNDTESEPDTGTSDTHNNDTHTRPVSSPDHITPDIDDAPHAFSDDHLDDTEHIVHSIVSELEHDTHRQQKQKQVDPPQKRPRQDTIETQHLEPDSDDDDRPAHREFISRSTVLPLYLRSLSPEMRREHLREVERQKIMGTAFSGGDTASSGKIIFVTGGKGGTGKTTVAWCLAAALSSYKATQGVTNNVYIVEADYRSPKLQQKLGIDSTKSVNNIARMLSIYDDNGGTPSARDVQTAIAKNIYHDDSYDINYLVCDYALNNQLDQQHMVMALTQSIRLIANRGGTVVIDGGILGESSYNMLDDIIISRLAHYVIVVADAGSVAESQRALQVLTGGTGKYTSVQHKRISEQGIRLVLNRADLRSEQIEDFQQISEPFRVIAALPDIPDLSPYKQKIGTKSFVTYIPKHVQRALVNRMGQALKWLGYKNSAHVFGAQQSQDEPLYAERPSLWTRLFGRMLRKK